MPQSQTDSQWMRTFQSDFEKSPVSPSVFTEILKRLQIAYDQTLVYAEELNQAISDRRRIQGELQQRLQTLKDQEKSLQELSTTLKVLLGYRQEDKNALEERVLANVKSLIFPCIKALKHTRLSHEQNVLVDLIEARLNDVVSQYVTTLKKNIPNLTPKELEVAAFIKDGITTKEIAELMHVSPRAIEFHRYNIRKKLKLTKSKTNLKTYLLAQG